MVRINGEALFATKVERDYTFYSKDKDGNYYKNNVAKGDYVALSDHDNSPQYALTQKEYFDALITRNPYYHTQNTKITQEDFEKCLEIDDRSIESPEEEKEDRSQD